MQTFLPLADLNSVRLLDDKRLGKQRVEALQILRALNGETKGWRNHPATKMWDGYTQCLSWYMSICIDEWVNRGFKNTMLCAYPQNLRISFPWWFGNDKFHASHRSNLLRKDPEFYGRYGWTESHDLPYVWPTKELTNAEV